ncbi:MAG TPA: SRPBCC domain-containing protein [Ktedonobacterales bacterium]|nr:SRPBCC domain-containing protein [Ktedonobacterales bacterium]
MAEPSPARASTQVTQLIKAPREAVYRAFLDSDMVAEWQHPENMRLQVHSFDPREGGTFRISLTYRDLQESPDGMGGKSSGDSDTYHGRFERLIPPSTIVEVVEFETQQPEFSGEMRITVRLADVEEGTEITYLCEDIPPGVRPEDNIAGCQSSLQRLATLLE